VDLGLTGRRALVTGASKGIGAATAWALAAEGVDVALAARSADALDERCRAIADAHGVRAFPVAGDLADPAAPAAAVAAAVEALGGLDILVNNVGASPNGTVEQVDDETWQASVDLKLLGYVRAMRAAAPHLRAGGRDRGAVVVNVLGLQGIQASAGYVLASINTALVHVTRSAAEHFAPDGIRVVAVHPGPTATDRLLRMFGGDRERAQTFAAGHVPIGRLVEPAEVAATITWLCGAPAAAITGESILVDGGAARGRV
jgi:NAD(P)-dependent dehydrogenase (short-subunit alcohol dehydrogenase family)